MKEPIKRRRAPKGDQRRILSPDALDIVQGRKPWPEDLLRWKLAREIGGYDNVWEDEDYMSPAQIAHERASEEASDRHYALFQKGPLPGETGDMFFARLDRDAPRLGEYVEDPAETRRLERRRRARRAMGGRT